jgi:two-component system nitrogen regulation response regulator GlnG
VNNVHTLPTEANRKQSLADNIRDIALYYVRHVADTAADKGLYYNILHTVEKPLLETVLKEVDGNQVKAARILGVNRNTLRKKMTDYEIKA